MRRASYYWDRVEPSPDGLSKMIDFLNQPVNDLKPHELIDSWLVIAEVLDNLKPSKKEPPKVCGLGGKPQPLDLSPKPPFLPMAQVDYSWFISEKSRKLLSHVQNELRCVLNSLLNPPKMGGVTSPLPFALETHVDGICHLTPDENGMLTVVWRPRGMTVLEHYKYQFFKLLDGQPLRKLHQCPVCGRFFTGKANKVYCSKQCGWRVGQRKFREKHKEQYRVYMQQLMYDKRRREAGLKPLNKWKGTVKNLKIGGNNHGSHSSTKTEK